MKKITTFLLILFCAFFSYSTIAQGTWTPQTSGVSVSLLGVSAVNANTVYVCGGSGTILKTTNGGTTWTPQTSGTSTDLYSICFTDANNGVAVGTGGVIRRTIDGGTTWTPVTATTDDLRCIWFYDANVGYMTGGDVGSYGSLFKTTNGGATWSPLTIASSNVMYGVYFVSATDGYACDFTGKIFITTNGGTSWSALTSGVSTPLYGIYFPSGSVGVATGTGGKIVRTSTSGAAWAPVTSGTTTDDFNGLSFHDASNGFIVGGNTSANTGLILRTTDAGATWTPYSPGSSRLYRVDFLDATRAWAVGLNGTILKYSYNVGVDEHENLVSINAYPNPASGATTIDMTGLNFDGKPTIQLFDISGKLVKKTGIPTSDKFILNQNELNAGVYFFTIYDNEKAIAKGKVIFN